MLMNCILAYEDFYYRADSDDVNEASQQRLAKLQDKKAHFAKRAAELQNTGSKISDTMAKLKDKSSKTKDPATAKIYQERIAEEGMKQQLAATRLQAVQQEEKIVDQQINIANLRLQASVRKAAKTT
jgi:hypothetical protein